MTNFEPSNAFENQIRAAVSVPDANPEFVEHLRGRLARIPAPQPKPRFSFRPVWALGIALALVVVIAVSSPGVVSAFKQLFRFVPGIGLVEQNGPLRMMEGPVSQERDGITLTIDHVLVYADRVELAYTVSGLPQELHGEAAEDGLYCSGADMYPRLGLPDGARIPADPMALGGSWAASGYTAGHSFSATIPEGAGGATFLLTCLQDTRRGAAPEGWEVPFSLVQAPADFQVGEPLAAAGAPAVAQTPAGQPAGAEIDFSFEGGALHDDGYHFFFHFSTQSDDPAFLSVRPLAVYALDSSGARIDLIYTMPWSPFDHVDVWDYRMVAAPAPGPLTLVVENAQIYYLAQDASFSFAPGADPAIGQTWQIGERFEIGGRALSVESAQMIELEGHPGFSFTIASADPELKLGAELMDMHSSAAGFELWSTTGAGDLGSRITPGFVYESAVPETIQVTFNTISVVSEGSWKLDWTPPAE